MYYLQDRLTPDESVGIPRPAGPTELYRRSCTERIKYDSQKEVYEKGHLAYLTGSLALLCTSRCSGPNTAKVPNSSVPKKSFSVALYYNYVHTSHISQLKTITKRENGLY